jgi:hypothetical protein
MTTDTNTEIQPQFWVHASLVDGELTPRGPFADEAEAQAIAQQFAGVCRALHQPVAIGVVSTPARRRA